MTDQADEAAARGAAMSALQTEMDEAVAALDFERASLLRDRLSLVRGGATPEDAVLADTAALVRQRPGKMGLGTSQQRMSPPPGWQPPTKPDPMTSGTRRRRVPAGSR